MARRIQEEVAGLEFDPVAARRRLRRLRFLSHLNNDFPELKKLALKAIREVERLQKEVQAMERIHGDHRLDEEGNPAGGRTTGGSFHIQWQDGPVGPDGKGRNGAFVEEVLEAALDRLYFLNYAADGKFRCSQNESAIIHVEKALCELGSRTRERRARGVEGTHRR